MSTRTWSGRVLRVGAAATVPVVGLLVLGAPPAAAAAFEAHVDFTTATGAVAPGYVRDSGSAWTSERGFGWIAQNSDAPLSITGNGRTRTGVSDPRLASYVHMQYAGAPSSGVVADARWQLAVPDGTYTVTVGVGDKLYYDSTHRVTVEGVRVIDDVVPTAATPFRTETAQVQVSDGFLTVDAAGGRNTKIGFIDVVGTETPPDPDPEPEPEPEPEPTGEADVSVGTTTTPAGLSTRLVFSTVRAAVRAPLALTLTNSGTAPLVVTRAQVGGAQAGAFTVTTALPLTVPVGEQRAVEVRFAPTAGIVENSASLTLSTNDPDRAEVVVPLSGLNSTDFEGAGEPYLAQILRVLGYGISVGSEKTYVSNTRLPAGDERISAYWNAADTSRPVGMVPLARYLSFQTTCPCSKAGWYRQGSATRNQLHSFAAATGNDGGTGNQRLFPVQQGATSFTPSGTFGIYTDDVAYSDDGLNPGLLHNWRFYQAKDSGGTAVPNTWLAVYDYYGTSGKNYDYQDQVYVLTNATPAVDPVAPISSSSSGQLQFSSSVGGSVTDANGLGTGFSSVQASTGGGTDRSRIVLDRANSVLRLSSSVGTYAGTTNTQWNALQRTYNAARNRSTVTARLLLGEPFAAGSQTQEQTLYYGPGQDDVFAVSVVNLAGGPALKVRYETAGTRPAETTTGTVPFPATAVAGLAQAGAVELRISANTVAGTLTAQYRLDPGGSFTTLATVTPKDVVKWFGVRAAAGILTSNAAGTAPTTAVVDSFVIASA
jgi:hypothetical protein